VGKHLLEKKNSGIHGWVYVKLRKGIRLRRNRFHHLRQINVVYLVSLGEPLNIITKLVRHKDLMVTTSIFTHGTDEQLATVSNAFAEKASKVNL
jgi:hypothetical protein